MGDHMDGWGYGFMGGGMVIWIALLVLLGVLIGVLIMRR